jgi:hypothetical protein
LACARDLHVFTERVGGGFGGKQEMISEDLCLLATMRTGRPVKWEFTREEQFIGATTRHQMTTRVKLGAKRDGTLTAIEVHVLSNTGGYGGDASETLAGALGSPLSFYPCNHKKAVGYAVYTNQVPGGGFRGYGSSQTTFAIESAIDDLVRCCVSTRSRSGARTWSDPMTGSSRYGRIHPTSALGAMASTNASTLSRALWPKAAASQNPKVMSGRRVPVLRRRCSRTRRPSIAPGR